MIGQEKIYKFCFVLTFVLLMQCCLGKPLEENQMKSEVKLLIPAPVHITDKNLTEYFANHTIKAARQILNDPTVIANHNKEVEEFKLNLTSIIDKYEEIKNDMNMIQNEDQNNATIDIEERFIKVIEHFVIVTKYYYELPEEKKTNNSKFISDILTKYDGYYVYKSMSSMANVFGKVLAKIIAELLFGWMKTKGTE